MIDTLKSFSDLYGWFKDPYSFLEKRLQKGELTFRLSLPHSKNILVTGDPRLIGAVRKNRDLIGGRGTRFLQVIIGDSTIAKEGADHQESRRILNPFFQQLKREEVIKITEGELENSLLKMQEGEVFPLSDWIEHVTLNSIIQFTFGDITEARKNEIFEAIFQWKRSFSNPLLFFIKAAQVPISSRFGWGKFVACRSLVHELIRRELKQPSFRSKAGVLENARLKADWPDDRLIAETVSILMFGHDTTAIVGAWWGFHMLSKKVWDGRLQAQPALSPELIESSIKEAMRLTPPVVHLTRTAIRNTQVLEHAIAEGEAVFPCMYLAHHNPAVFEKPSQFQADRFIGPKIYDQDCLFPFGFGDRICLGKLFAEVQLSVIGRWLISKVQLELAKDDIGPSRKFVLMVPSGGTPVRLLKKL